MTMYYLKCQSYEILDSVLDHDAPPVQVVGGLLASLLDLVQEPLEGPRLSLGKGVQKDRVHRLQNLLDPVVVDVVRPDFTEPFS